MNNRPYVYVNPQSIRNLAIYDHSLLSNIKGEIHYVCSKHYDYKAMPAHVHAHRYFHYNCLNSNWRKAVSYLWSHISLFFLLLRVQPSVVHLQWLRIPSFDVCFYRLMKRLTGCRLVFTAHNVLPHDTGDRHKRYYGSFYKMADAIIVHTDITRQELLATFDIPAAKVHVIAHGILQVDYSPDVLEQQRASYDAHYQLDGCMVFSALGYQYAYKGVDTLAEVWASTPELRDNPRCKLLLVGKNRGVDLSAAEGISNVMVDDRLISDEEFIYLLQRTDIYLLPYRRISQSGVLLTAITTSTPVLVTEVGGLTEPFAIAPMGWTLPRLDASLLREKLLWLLNHPDEVARMKRDTAAWDKIRAYYDWGRIGSITQQVYDEPAAPTR